MFYKYFCYRHVRLDKNEPFYIGIGKRTSPDMKTGHYSRAYQKSKRNKHWKNIVAKTNYIIEIIYESDNRDEILQKEKEFIALYGRRDLGKGTLVNLTDGGEFFDGYVQSDELRQKRSDFMKLMSKQITKESRALAVKIRKENGSYKFTEETKEKIRQSRLGKKLSKESIDKRTETRRLNTISRGYYITEEQKAANGKLIRDKKFPLEKRLLVLEYIKEGKNNWQIHLLTGVSCNAIKRVRIENES